MLPNFILLAFLTAEQNVRVGDAIKKRSPPSTGMSERPPKRHASGSYNLRLSHFGAKSNIETDRGNVSNMIKLHLQDWDWIHASASEIRMPVSCLH